MTQKISYSDKRQKLKITDRKTDHSSDIRYISGYAMIQILLNRLREPVYPNDEQHIIDFAFGYFGAACAPADNQQIYDSVARFLEGVK